MSQQTLQKHISRLMALLLCLMLFLTCVPVARAEGGSCGDSLSWSFDGSTLTISGSGVMDNYTEDSHAPWYEYRNSILSLSLPEGLTRIGSWAFADLSVLSSVVIPASVELIDESAFRRCTNLAMVSFQEGLRTIGVCAFEQCSSLADIRFPNTLIAIYNHAFYMCESLTYVTIPGAVSTMGSGVFAYCSNLIRADINAAVTVPGWTFYGCDRLQIVTIQGTSVPPETLMVTTAPQGLAGSSSSQPQDSTSSTESTTSTEPVVPPAEGYASSETIVTDTSGTAVVDKTTVSKNDDATVITTTQTPLEDTEKSHSVISSTVQNDAGWQDVTNKVDSVLVTNGEDPVEVTVMTPNSDTVSKEVLQEYAGKNVTLTVKTQSGATFILDCDNMDKDKIGEDLKLSYTITPAEDIPESMAGCVVYLLKFHTSATFDMEIVMRLPADHSLQTASLFELENKDNPALLQSVLVDNNGDAHFYLASVDEEMDYLIGIDVPVTDTAHPIIPENMYDEYTLVDNSTGKPYVITGRSSSWNMGLGKVMAILAVVMVSAIVVVGAVMFFWNKQRLKAGYVPQWDDEEENT